MLRVLDVVSQSLVNQRFGVWWIIIQSVRSTAMRRAALCWVLLVKQAGWLQNVVLSSRHTPAPSSDYSFGLSSNLEQKLGVRTFCENFLLPLAAARQQGLVFSEVGEVRCCRKSNHWPALIMRMANLRERIVSHRVRLWVIRWANSKVHEFSTVSTTWVVNSEGSFSKLGFSFHTFAIWHQAVSFRVNLRFGDKFHASQLTSKMSYRVFSPGKLLECGALSWESVFQCFSYPRSFQDLPPIQPIQPIMCLSCAYPRIFTCNVALQHGIATWRCNGNVGEVLSHAVHAPLRPGVFHLLTPGVEMFLSTKKGTR